MRRVFLIALALVAILSATPAIAADYKFHLWNKTTQYTITGFQTYENDKWSSWTGVSAAPGDDLDMNWGSNEGSCTVPFRILYAEIQTEQYSVDWCKVKNIYVTDTNVTYD